MEYQIQVTLGFCYFHYKTFAFSGSTITFTWLTSIRAFKYPFKKLRSWTKILKDELIFSCFQKKHKGVRNFCIRQILKGTQPGSFTSCFVFCYCWINQQIQHHNTIFTATCIYLYLSYATAEVLQWNGNVSQSCIWSWVKQMRLQDSPCANLWVICVKLKTLWQARSKTDKISHGDNKYSKHPGKMWYYSVMKKQKIAVQ